MAGTAVVSSVPDQEEPPVVDEIVTDEQLTDGADGAAEAEAAIEARAREMGWKPLAEYRGPPGRWQPAKDFIERGENILPIVRDQNRRLTERVGKLEGEISGLRSTAQEQLQIIKDLRDMGARANQQGYERAMAEIKTNQRKAVEAGDTVAYDQLVEQAEALESGRPAPPAPKTEPAAPPAPQASPATQAFLSANAWFRNDQFLNRKMIDAHLDVIQEGQIVDEAAQYEEAKHRLIDAYPDRFGVPPPLTPPPQPARVPGRRASAVAAQTPGDGAPPRAPGSAQVTIASIADPADRAQAREAFNRMKRQLPDYTEAEYMALYSDPHGDVLTLQQKPRK